MDIKFIIVSIIALMLIIWNFVQQVKIKKLKDQLEGEPSHSNKSFAPLDQLTKLWSAIVEFRDQSLIFICPIDDKDPQKVEQEKSKRERELSTAIEKLRQIVDLDRKTYSEYVITKTQEILSFADTILSPRDEGDKYQNLCQSYRNIHQLTLELNKLIQERMGARNSGK